MVDHAMEELEKNQQHASNRFVSVRHQPSAPFGSFPIMSGVTIILLALCSVVAATPPQWKNCEGLGKEYQCSSLAVPLDYRNESDGRTINIALTRLLARDRENRKGAVFVNPGGPGGSGTDLVMTLGANLSAILNGQHDIIGADPRGVKMSEPYVSCFKNALAEDVFASTAALDILNLPVNMTAFDNVYADLSRQVELQSAGTASLAKRCLARSGEILPYLGTENVVKDIDYLMRAIEGDNTPINYWGISYGTLIGQYMVKILPPERLGRIVLDSIVNPDQWSKDSLHFFDTALQDFDKVLLSFASSCLEAGPNCTLNSGPKFESASALLAKIDSTIDELYAHPAPVYGLEIPAIATARNMRQLLFNNMYSIAFWPSLSNILLQAFNGDFSGLIQSTTSPIQGDSANKSDSSSWAQYAIICADVAPYTDSNPAPKNSDVVDSVLDKLKTSSRVGEAMPGRLCHKWTEAGLPSSQSRYGGPFNLEDNTLKTPLLILTNTYDPVTPLAGAIMASERLGNNARLIQQIDGLGHTITSHISYCTLLALREYMVEGKLPEEKHTMCKVDQKPFIPFENVLASSS